MNYSKQMQRIVRHFEEETGKSSYSAKEVARWAIENDEWVAQPEMLIGRCAEEVAKALREEYVTDPQGRRARVKHSALIKQEGQQLKISIWFDSRRATHDQMELSFQQRPKGVVSDCRQLKTDVDSYNDNYNNGEQIKIVFDFTTDLLEAEMANSKKKISTNQSQSSSRKFSDVVRRSGSSHVPSRP